jgi:hypothetical protein
MLIVKPPKFPAIIKPTDKLRQGEWLAVDQVLTSSNGQFTLSLLPTANFQITRKSDSAKVITASAKNVTGAQLLCFDRDANDLVVYNKDGKQTHRDGKLLWKAGNTNPFGWTKTEFIMQDDGNAVFYMKGDVVWSARDNLASGSVMFAAPPNNPTPKPNPAPAPNPKPQPQPQGGGAGGGTSDWTKGGENTNCLRPGQVLKYGQDLISDVLRKFSFGIDYQGLLYVRRAQGSPSVIWTSGTDTAVAKTAYLQITNRGQLVIRGVMRPEDGGQGGEITLWTGGKYLQTQSQEPFLMIEDDGCPAVYQGRDAVWRPQDWRKGI